MEISKKQYKKLLSESRMQKPRVHIGLNGVTNNLIIEFVSAFAGGTLRKAPADMIRVKMQKTYAGLKDEERLNNDIKRLERNGTKFLFRDGCYLIFQIEKD